MDVNPATTVPDIPLPDPAGWQNDAQAAQEEKNWKQLDDLSKAKRDNALLIHKTIRFLIPGALILGFLGFAELSVTYVAHLLLPVECRWLSADEVQHIHSMIFSGVVGGAIAIMAKMYLADDKPK